ncbi:pyruvate formate lyase family protein, partial [Bacteroidota bacterium]
MKSYWKTSLEEQAIWLLEFTKIHSSFPADETEAREAAILAHQFPAIFLPPEEDDMLVGKFHYPPLSFTPQPAGDRGGFAYVSDPRLLKELKDKLRDSELKQQLKETEDYWMEHDTGQQTRKAYPPEIATLLPSDNWTGEPGIGFPLLRMSGSQLDYDKLMKLGIQGLEKEILDKKTRLPESSKLFTAMSGALNALKQVIIFYERAVRDLMIRSKTIDKSLHFETLAKALEHIREHPPGTLLEG